MKLLTFNSYRYTVKELAALSGVSAETIRHRLAAGWTVEQAVTVPSIQQRRAGMAHSLILPTDAVAR